MDLVMLVLTDGKERTIEQYRGLRAAQAFDLLK